MADNYNYDMQRLQQDAIRRAREMQSRAQMTTPPLSYPAPRPPASVQTPPPLNRPAAPPKPPPVPVQTAPQAPPPHEHHAPAGAHPHEREQPQNQLSPISDIFESLLSDSERTLLLVLILLLVEEKADTGLIFALMYLAL